jgi:3-hydroxybutyryl-CoA dehydratase
MKDGLNWYEDLAVGDRFTTEGIVVTEAHIVTFAGLSGDFFSLHMDDTAARELGFPRRVAHGILGLALIDGLKNRAEQRFRAVASLGWTWRFTGPLLVGDRLHAEIEIAALRPTRRVDRGIATLRVEGRNQDGTVVQEGTNDLLVLRQPTGQS